MVTQALRKIPDVVRQAGEVRALQQQLGELYAEREQVASELRASMPDLADLEAPEPVPLTELAQAFGVTTALLSYSIGAERSFLFVVTRDAGGKPELQVTEIDVTEAALREAVSAIRILLRVPTAGDQSEAALAAQSHDLYRRLIEPATALIGVRDRLVIVPDSALHLLPFSSACCKAG